MSFYANTVFPWACDHFMATRELDAVRAELLARAAGDVVEIGFGTGLNLPHYPASLRRLVAVEPNPGMRRRARRRIEAAPFPVELVGVEGEGLPLPDGVFDTAVTTFTLCSVRDPARVTAELRRVLRDDGVLLVAEHGLAPDPRLARVQRRLTPVQKVVACGCHLDRDVDGMVKDGGFRWSEHRSFALRKAPRPLGWVTMGVARKA